jgi:hypothetical protein
MPDDPNDLRDWLEAVVAQGGAAELAEQLAAVQGPQAGPPVFLPSDVPPAVRQRGFAALTDGHLRTVLKNPRLLVALAEDVLANGGPYWTRRLAAEPAFDDRVAAGWERLHPGLSPTEPAAPAARPGRTRFSVAPWVASLATAAAVLLAVYFIPGLRNALGPDRGTGQVAAAAWGWQKTGELAAVTTPADYLDRIADLADEWKTRDTSTPVALAERITEFRLGCAKLQLMEHRPLTAEQRGDLLARCRKWAAKFDASLAELEATGDAAKVRSEMDATVAQMTAALRAEAAKIRAG